MKFERRALSRILLLLYYTVGSSQAFMNDLLFINTEIIPPTPLLPPPDQFIFVAAHYFLDPLFRSGKEGGGGGLPVLPLVSQKFPTTTITPPRINIPPLLFEPPSSVSPLVSIKLTKEEEELFQCIREVRDTYSPDTTLRVAGGWVRDKLLQQVVVNVPSSDDNDNNQEEEKSKSSSSDIDFVLNDKSGTEFAQLAHEYLVSTAASAIQPPAAAAAAAASSDDDNQQQQQPPGGGGSGVFCAIRSDALLKTYGKRSKHLNTASLKIGNHWVDFCNLRSEKYNRDTRIPEATGIASVVEDAWRRDLTINALYYNINSNQIEDWTEQGLRDIFRRTISTPMAPLPTLLEDPLRILRAVRFAAQLPSFSMDPDLMKAASDHRVKRALAKKVSKNRIGHEIDLMFQTPDPVRAVRLLIETNLEDVVFPVDMNMYMSEGVNLLSKTQELANQIDTTTNNNNNAKYDLRLLSYAAFFKPYFDNRPSKRKLFQLLNQGLKRPKSDIHSIENIIVGADTIDDFLKTQHPLFDGIQSMMLENDIHHILTTNFSEEDWKQITDFRWRCYNVLKQVGPLWKESLILALSKEDANNAAVERYSQLVTLIDKQLCLATNQKPLLNGSQIQEVALPGAPKGIGFKKVMAVQEEWQVRHPGGSQTDLVDHLVHVFPEYADG